MTNLITLTTDFGLIDGFVGVMKGVILSINPDARIVDITHGVERQDIRQGAFLLANSLPYFPPAIHVCVVDPGVGSSRAALAIQVGESTLIGPDNGVLSLAVEVLRAKSGAVPRAFRLTNPKFWLDPVSTTFHGRDVFSPSAAHLSRGVPLTELGSPAEDYITIAPSRPELRPDGSLVGHVIYIDRYGNIVSDIDQTMLARLGKGKPVVILGGRHIHGLVRTYSDVELGEFAALIGSPWKLEVARRQGNAADALGVSIGDEIKVRTE
ncbi:MAG: S-adenosyl-l-methionine hydroxide adenosyltransferase family protein [Rudaea sp.]